MFNPLNKLQWLPVTCRANLQAFPSLLCLLLTCTIKPGEVWGLGLLRGCGLRYVLKEFKWCWNIKHFYSWRECMRVGSLLISVSYWSMSNELLLKHVLHVTKIRPYTHFPSSQYLKLMKKKNSLILKIKIYFPTIAQNLHLVLGTSWWIKNNFLTEVPYTVHVKITVMWDITLCD